VTLPLVAVVADKFGPLVLAGAPVVVLDKIRALMF
jgi:hypothetical protein